MVRFHLTYLQVFICVPCQNIQSGFGWTFFNLWHLDFDNFENVHEASYQYCLLVVNKKSEYLQSTQFMFLLGIFGAKCLVTSLHVVRTFPYDVMATMSAFALLSQTLKFTFSILMSCTKKRFLLFWNNKPLAAWRKKKRKKREKRRKCKEM